MMHLLIDVFISPSDQSFRKILNITCSIDLLPVNSNNHMSFLYKKIATLLAKVHFTTWRCSLPFLSDKEILQLCRSCAREVKAMLPQNVPQITKEAKRKNKNIFLKPSEGHTRLREAAEGPLSIHTTLWMKSNSSHTINSQASQLSN